MKADKFRVKPGSKVNLNKFATRGKSDQSKEALQADMLEVGAELAALQLKLYAEDKQSLLVVLQGMDAAGKDGVIRQVMQPLNTQGVRVSCFKQPSSLELSHDFLWRVHAQVPERGEIVIFNRSHYEDVLVVRTHKLVPKAVWKQRYEHINAFEKLLVEQNNTRIVKIFLHMSPQEQLERFRERLENPEKNWKISDSDYSERELWPDYMAAYEDALSRTSTPWAPWHIVPADDNRTRNLTVAKIVRHALREMNIRMPEPNVDLEAIRAKYHTAANNAALAKSKVTAGVKAKAPTKTSAQATTKIATKANASTTAKAPAKTSTSRPRATTKRVATRKTKVSS